MLEFAGLFIGILGIVFAFETPRKSVVAFFRGRRNSNAAQQQVSASRLSLIAPTASNGTMISGATQSGR